MGTRGLGDDEIIVEGREGMDGWMVEWSIIDNYLAPRQFLIISPLCIITCSLVGPEIL